MVISEAILSKGVPAAKGFKAPRVDKVKRNRAHKDPILLFNDAVVGNLLENSNWQPRDQKLRGTCNAFAVVAAEEIARNRIDPDAPLAPLSEEQFYAAIRRVPQDKRILQISDETIAENKITGATYLLQVKDALVQSGIAAADLLPYRPDEAQGYYDQNIPQNVADDAATRRLLANQITHNIMDLGQSAGPPNGIVWHNPIDAPVSEIFIDKLRDGLPIVAAFAILTTSSWLGYQAEDYGQIIYNRALDQKQLSPAFGHTVCIVGYRPASKGDDRSGGWFLFRNSWGDGFARHRGKDPFHPQAPAKGYGYISASDVDAYCWEFLFRSGSIMRSDWSWPKSVTMQSLASDAKRR